MEKERKNFQGASFDYCNRSFKRFLSKKKELADKYDKIFNKKSSIKTAEYKRYIATFGVESTVESLIEVSNYTIDQVWLFSVELFVKEVKKFNMKIDASSKEMDHELELIRQRQEALSKKS